MSLSRSGSAKGGMVQAEFTTSAEKGGVITDKALQPVSAKLPPSVRKETKRASGAASDPTTKPAAAGARAKDSRATLSYLFGTRVLEGGSVSTSEYSVVRSIDTIVRTLLVTFCSIDAHHHQCTLAFDRCAAHTLCSTFPDVTNGYISSLILFARGMTAADYRTICAALARHDACVPGSSEWGAANKAALAPKRGADGGVSGAYYVLKARNDETYKGLRGKDAVSAGAGGEDTARELVRAAPVLVMQQREKFVDTVVEMVCNLCFVTIGFRLETLKTSLATAEFLHGMRKECVSQFDKILNFVTTNLFEFYLHDTDDVELGVFNIYAAWADTSHAVPASIAHRVLKDTDFVSTSPGVAARAAGITLARECAKHVVPRGLAFPDMHRADVLSDTAPCMRQFIAVLAPFLALLHRLNAERETAYKQIVSEHAFNHVKQSTDTGFVGAAVAGFGVDNYAAQRGFAPNAAVAGAVEQASKAMLAQHGAELAVGENALVTSIVLLVEREVAAQCRELLRLRNACSVGGVLDMVDEQHAKMRKV